MKSITKRITFAIMVVLLITALILGIVLLKRVLDVFLPDTNSQVSGQAPSNNSGNDSNSDSLPPDHIHEYAVDKVIDPGCDSSGYTLYLCTCGKSDIRELTSPLGHSYGESTTVPATCETDGYTERVCRRCHYPERTNLVPAAHAFGDWLPNDMAPQETRICTVCELAEIRSADLEQLWLLQLPCQQNVSHYTLQQVILKTAPDAEPQIFELYLDGTVTITGYDYAESAVAVFYTANGIRSDYIFSTEDSIITVHPDGSCTPGAPVMEEPTPEPDPAPDTETE